MCPRRKENFCGPLLDTPSAQAHLGEESSWQEFQRFLPGQPVVIDRALSGSVYVLCDGWAFRFRELPDGRRQILSFLLPGDLFFAKNIFREELVYSVKALTDIHVSRFARTTVLARLAVNPAILEAIQDASVADTEHSERLLVAIGQGSAEERIAFLVFDLTKRLAQRNVIRNHRYPFPLRLQHIADATGLTPIHVSRVITRFRKRGLIDLSGSFLTVLDPAELERIGSMK
jgi:CRP/FNR family transcriptional regulator